MALELAINDKIIPIDALAKQTYKNMSVIPIKTEFGSDVDILNLNKGLDLGIVTISECEPSTVGEVLVKNDAVNPLILLDGDEIIGANQNRIVNSSLLIPPHTTMKVSVSCTEKGRWQYTKGFEHSKYLANSKTRTAKEYCNFHQKDLQSVVWESIDELESDLLVKSKTSAMSESYETFKNVHDDYIKHFPLENMQTGAAIIIDGAIKGIEIMQTPSLYKQYHEKILRSYIIDNDFKGKETDGNEFETVINGISHSEFSKKTNDGWGDSLKVINDYGIGSVLLYENELIHFQYFKKPEITV